METDIFFISRCVCVVLCCAEAQARLWFWPADCVPACRQRGPAAAVTVSDFGGWPAPPPPAAWSPLDGLAAGGCPVNAPVQTCTHTQTERLLTQAGSTKAFVFAASNKKNCSLGVFLTKLLKEKQKGSHLFYVITHQRFGSKIPEVGISVCSPVSQPVEVSVCFHLRFWSIQEVSLSPTLVHLPTLKAAPIPPWLRLLRDHPPDKDRLSFVQINSLKCLLGNDSFTSSSTCMRAERSLSSCCRSSIISLLSSSSFSSSMASGEPIPSSFSSARLLFGDEPLNSWGGRNAYKNTSYLFTTINLVWFLRGSDWP